MGGDLADGIKWYLVFLFSTSFHEAAHAWAALRLGDDTAARGGQVSLDPVPHLRRAPLGMVVVPILSYLFSGWMMGWASAPYSVAWATRYPRRAALMGLAGPAANLLLALASAFLIRLSFEWGWLHPASTPNFLHIAMASGDGLDSFAAKMLSLIFSLNLLLCVFNLLPLPPLDGSVLPLFVLPPALAEKYLTLRRHPSLAYLGIYFAWHFFGPFYAPIQTTLVHGLCAGL